MSHPNLQPLAQVEVTNITKNTKCFRINIKPIENLEEIELYNIYTSSFDYNLTPNSNPNKLLFRQIPYSTEEKNIFYIPETTGNHYITIFAQNKLGLESTTGLLFSGEIPYQNFVKEINIQNLNFYSKLVELGEGITSGGMEIISNQASIENKLEYSLLGYHLNYVSPTLETVRIYDQTYISQDFSTFFKDKNISVHHRIIPAISINSGILFDQGLLKSNDSDVFSETILGNRIVKAQTTNSILIQDPEIFANPEYLFIPKDNSRYFIYDYPTNLDSFLSKNFKYIEGNRDDILTFNPEAHNSESFLNSLLSLTGNNPNTKFYTSVSEAGYYNSYYMIIEAVDENGFSSAGGNIKINNDPERYINQDGYRIIKIEHNSIKRQDAIDIFKNYNRGKENEIYFDIKGVLPEDAGIQSAIILPQRYNSNINKDEQKEYFDEFIFLDKLNDLSSNRESNYKVELIDSQNNSKYRITAFMNPDSLLLKDNIFSVKLYYLNKLQTSVLKEYLKSAGYKLQNVLYFLTNTDLIDKYINLNKFIKNNDNYTSTIAASYQGLIYFFTPESYPYISWPNQSYREKYLNKYGARMLDFERDGVSSGPQFFNYFPIANAEINNSFPSSKSYKTTYRCLDSYKYQSELIPTGLYPEDIPNSGINGSETYLGAYDPGNIGDQESPGTADFKSVNKELTFFKSKNINSIKVLSVGVQKNDAYSIVEFILDIPDAEDFIVQGISGTDSILEKGIKEIDGINYHYFVAKFVSSCGIDEDPILEGIKINQKNIIDSKKMISFLIYPTQFKIVEDEFDVPIFGSFYVMATDPANNQFNIVKSCSLGVLSNNSDCNKGCCVDQGDPINKRVPYKPFYIISNYIPNQLENYYPYGKIGGTDRFILGSLNWRYKALDYSTTYHSIKYKKPTEINNYLNFGIIFYPEHNVAVNKVFIYMKKTNDINLTLWQGSDLVDYYEFDNIIKSIPIYLSIPDFSFSRKGFQLFDKLSNDYKNWILNQQSFAIKILITDKSGDSIEQIFFFQNDQNC